MTRKLIALSFSVLSFNAFAEVTLYGRLAVGAENDQYQNTSIPGSGSIQDFGSYFGIRGSDPVYGRTSVIWQLENRLDVTAGQAYTSTSGGGLIIPNPNAGTTPSGAGKVSTQYNDLTSGNSYLGLQGEWGSIIFGNLNNYGSSNMGSVDTFNSANGVQGFGTYDRYSKRLPASVRYDSPTWNGFNFSALYSFNNLGQGSTSGISNSNTLSSNLNGNYSSGVYNLGVGWKKGNFAINATTSIWQDVGYYMTSSGITLGTAIESISNTNAGYPTAYINTIEISYEDPDGLMADIGFQTSSGLGWSSWANSGGSFGNMAFGGPTYIAQMLQSNEYQTQEFAVSAGYHFGVWTPKIGYAYGNNLMINGNPWSVATGNANQIPNSGYQTASVELDWNITPRTLVFANFGQIWYGTTLQYVAYSSTSVPTAPTSTNQGSYQNQSSAAIGMSHTF